MTVQVRNKWGVIWRHFVIKLLSDCHKHPAAPTIPMQPQAHRKKRIFKEN